LRLFHFSEEPDLARFEPRPVRIPSPRPAGREWLNGPLVWAIDEPHQPMYLFPRECPRILLWARPDSTPQDRAAWLSDGSARMVAYVEDAWMDRIARAKLVRYELPPATFESLEDAGMWVSRAAVEPIDRLIVDDLAEALAAQRVEVRALPSLTPLGRIWDSSLHASGIRLRNARDWPALREAGARSRG